MKLGKIKRRVLLSIEDEDLKTYFDAINSHQAYAANMTSLHCILMFHYDLF
jgi:hypothetical protein